MAESTKVTPQDVDQVAGKLQEFAQGLPEQQRQILGWIVARASAAGEEDVAGYATGQLGSFQSAQLTGFQSGFSSQFGRAAGFGRLGGTNPAALTISWSW